MRLAARYLDERDPNFSDSEDMTMPPPLSSSSLGGGGGGGRTSYALHTDLESRLREYKQGKEGKELFVVVFFLVEFFGSRPEELLETFETKNLTSRRSLSLSLFPPFHLPLHQASAPLSTSTSTPATSPRPRPPSPSWGPRPSTRTL